ncbi:MAG: CoA transferase [Alphaproteobacteria bacterium]
MTAQSPSTTPDGAGPLAGIVVLDLTRVLAGPYCTMVLANLGARVIKIERPGTGEDSRAFGPYVNGVSAYFLSLNHGKQSLALDLKLAEDRAVFDRLLARADVLVENFRPGTLDRLGYGWEAVHARHPRLVYAACSGFGQTGPYADRPAYDMVVQAMGGIMSITGQPGAPPTRVGTSVGDITAGLFTAIGIQAALIERARTGTGQLVDVAMLDCQVAILENAIARYVATGRVPGPMGARHPSITPFEAFHADDGHIIIAAGNDSLFARLASALGRPELAADPRFATNDARTAHVDAVKTEIEAALAGGSVAHWLAVLQAAGVPCGPINDVATVLADPHIRGRNMIATLADGPNAGFVVAGNPIKLSGHADTASRPGAPVLDADRPTILAWLNNSHDPGDPH